MKVLKGSGANANQVIGKDGESALHRVAKKDSLETVKCLVKV